MWYHPGAFFVRKRDVIGAWVICLALATAFFAYPVVITALDVWAEDFHTAAADGSPGR
jgi:hypothetical protein